MMRHISIIPSSLREGRKSHNVALYFQLYLQENKLATTEILDLKAYNFPLFKSSLKTMLHPAENILEFADKIQSSDGIIIVTPEYKGGFPASLKNVIDLLYEEWQGKPVGISTVSSGVFGGAQALVSLQFVLCKIGAWTFSSMFPVPNGTATLVDTGRPLNQKVTVTLAQIFLTKLIESIEVTKRIPIA